MAHKVRVKRKRGSGKGGNSGTDPLKPELSEAEVAEQNRRFFTVLGVIAFLVLATFVVLQFV